MPISVARCLFVLTALAPASQAGDLFVDVGRGPVPVRVPAGYDPAEPAPLIVMLHGYGSSGAGQEGYVQLGPLVDTYGFIYTYPDGTRDGSGSRFWNATDACCDFDGSGVDDAAYLLALIEEIGTVLSVDPDRVHFAGLSNGGFMSHRMACEFPEVIASIAPLAGVTYFDPLDCDPFSPVHVLQIHGTADTVIRYEGGSILGVPYPGAVASTESWAAFDGCVVDPETLPGQLDLDASIPGAETVVTRYDEGCLSGGSAELWTIHGGSHVPPLTQAARHLVVEFLLSHPRTDVVAVPPDPGSDPLGLQVVPNPFAAAVTISITLDGSGEVWAAVYDVHGRRVRTLLEAAPRAAGRHEVTWDGRDAAGRDVSTGVYFVRVAGPGGSYTERILRRPTR